MSQTNPQIAALIVAAGTGSRLGGARPKPYQLIGNKPIITHTLEKFLHHPDISTIQTVIHADHQTFYDEATAHLELPKPVVGGATRQTSVRNGLKALSEHYPTYVLVHDAARPFVSEKIISDVIAVLSQHKAVLPVIPVTDTIKQVNEGRVVATPPRESLFQAQTPQGFDFGTLYKLHEKYATQEVTDDIALAEQDRIEVATVVGSEHNIKITNQEDLELAQLWITKHA